MTKEALISSKSQYSYWLRQQQEIDSSKGFICVDIDYVWFNYKSGLFLFKEEKQYNAQPDFYQIDLFKMIHASHKDNLNYRGIHIITFQNTNPDDGKIFWDGYEITKEKLLEILTFKADKIWYETLSKINGYD